MVDLQENILEEVASQQCSHQHQLCSSRPCCRRGNLSEERTLFPLQATEGRSKTSSRDGDGPPGQALARRDTVATKSQALCPPPRPLAVRSFPPWAPVLAILGCSSSEAPSHVPSSPPFFLMDTERGVSGLFMAHKAWGPGHLLIQPFLPNTLRARCLLVVMGL